MLQNLFQIKQTLPTLNSLQPHNKYTKYISDSQTLLNQKMNKTSPLQQITYIDSSIVLCYSLASINIWLLCYIYFWRSAEVDQNGKRVIASRSFARLVWVGARIQESTEDQRRLWSFVNTTFNLSFALFLWKHDC